MQITPPDVVCIEKVDVDNDLDCVVVRGIGDRISHALDVQVDRDVVELELDPERQRLIL